MRRLGLAAVVAVALGSVLLRRGGDRADGAFRHRFARALVEYTAVSPRSPGRTGSMAGGVVLAHRRSAALCLNDETGPGRGYRLFAVADGPGVPFTEMGLDGRGLGVSVFSLDRGLPEHQRFRVEPRVEPRIAA